MHIVRIVSLLLVFYAAAPCSAAEPGADAVLERLSVLTASIDSLRCDFTQTTTIPLFTEPVISQGRLLFRKPDSLVWEYATPAAQGLVFSGGRGFRWEEDKSRRVPFATAEDPVAGLIASQMLAWIRFDRTWLEAQYAIRVEKEEPLSLVLTPKSADMRSVLASLAIRFAGDGIARDILLTEASGGVTEILFHNVLVNGPMDAGEFR